LGEGSKGRQGLIPAAMQQNHKLIAADTGSQIAFPNDTQQSVGRASEDMIPQGERA
jgi:hypothetical protein